MIELVEKGGYLMWVLLGCSVFAVGIFFERSFFFHRSTTSVHHLLKGLANLIKKTMAKKPDQRPDSMWEFLKEFNSLRLYKKPPEKPEKLEISDEPQTSF